MKTVSTLALAAALLAGSLAFATPAEAQDKAAARRARGSARGPGAQVQLQQGRREAAAGAAEDCRDQ